ncbi:MAG TPA: OmpA family protein [Bacteroidetes bacterium]|nr:OmpA family protein [Bacteroidota bacterium]
MKKLFCIFLALLPLLFVQAQIGEMHSQHPLFDPIPGFKLLDLEKQDFGAFSFCDINGDHFLVEGQITYCYFESDNTVDPKAILTRFQEIGDSLKANIYGDGKNQLYMIIHTTNKLTYVNLYAEDFYYTLNIVERGELKSAIDSEALLKDLRDIGKAVLYFNFKRNECELTSDCREIIEMIAKVLKSVPTMGISIDAYTDNIGRSDENLELSEKRAEMLCNELVKLGVDGQRMVFNGFGEKNPIADNNTVMGRAFNNRIELVKK